MRAHLHILNLHHLLAAGVVVTACSSCVIVAAEAPTQDISSALSRLPTDTPGRVGDLGEPDRLSIEGAQTFTEGAIRRALRSDLDYLVASRPEATITECLAGLENRVRAGYRDCGFPDVRVQARFDPAAGRIVAKVTEGPRFRCGLLRVTGLKSIPASDFTRRFAEKLALASEQTAAPPVIWKAGAPASFTPDSLAKYSAAASNTFAALGRFAATFKVEIQRQPASRDAVLAVIVADEGPAAVLRDIEVVGNKQNRPEAVIGFLGLSNGMEVTQDLIDEKALALTQAARFADASITPTVSGPNGQVSLRVAVVENGRLPPLQQPLSREERALLSLREWLLAWESRQDDLIVDWSPLTAQGKGPQRIEVIVAPSGGIVTRVMGNSPGHEELQDLYSTVLSSEALTLFAQIHQRKLRIPLPTGCSGLFFVRLGPCTNCTSRFSLSVGAGLSATQADTSWKLRLDLLPAAFTDLLYRPGTKTTWQGDVLTVRTEDLEMRADEGTGRLLELGSSTGESASAPAESGAYRLTVRFASGAFAKAVDQIAAGASTDADAFQSKRALGSALGFIAAELVRAEPMWRSASGGHAPPPKAALASALEKLLTSSFLDPLLTLLNEAKLPPSDREFTIPTRRATNQDSVHELIDGITVWCASHARELAPAGSWLQILLREPGFTFSSKTGHTPAALARLAATDELGPIGCFVAFHALPAEHRDSWASLPELGLRRLTVRDFRRDYRMLLSPESVITRCLANLTRELGTLEKPEVEAIAGILPPDCAAAVRESAEATRKTKDLPVTEVVGPVLDRWWETTAREKVEADFRFHAQQPARR